MDAQRRPRFAFELAFALAAVTTTLPLFAGRYIPLQDLPQHVAAVRVLHDYHVESLGFERFFELSLSSTQYLSVYLLAHWLAYLTGTLLATKLVLGGALVALPYAMRALLRALGRPESLSLLVLPLAYNAHLVLGFLNFIAALPLLFWGLALALRAKPERAHAQRVGLALVALACFYTHVIPYGMLLVGAALVLATRNSRLAVIRGSFLVPSFIAAMLWLASSPAGASLIALANGQSRETLQLGRSLDAAFEEAPLWLTDVFSSGQGRIVLVGWFLVALFVVSIRKSDWLDAQLFRFRASRKLLFASTTVRDFETTDHDPRMRASGTTRGDTATDASASRRLLLLVPIACLGYFALPESFAFMWPIHARFPLLVLLCAIPVLPTQSASLRLLTALACLGLSGHGTFVAWQAFRGASEREYAGLSEIIAKIPEGSRVAGLMFSRGSEFVRFAPYLHAVAWIQAERGGAVMFSFAEFPASPFRFRDDNRPPRVPPRWEWTPERVDPARDLDFFDYVLTRSGPLRLSGFRPLHSSREWSLFGRL